MNEDINKFFFKCVVMTSAGEKPTSHKGFQYEDGGPI